MYYVRQIKLRFGEAFGLGWESHLQGVWRQALGEGGGLCEAEEGGWGEVRERRDRKKYITVEEKHSMHPMNYFLPPSVWFAGNKAKWRVGFIQGAFGRRIVRKKNLKLKRFFFCGGRRGGLRAGRWRGGGGAEGWCGGW